jgi:hypothetical protein
MVWITRDRTNDRCEMLGQAPRRCRGGDNDTALIEVMRDVDDPGVWSQGDFRAQPNVVGERRVSQRPSQPKSCPAIDCGIATAALTLRGDSDP